MYGFTLEVAQFGDPITDVVSVGVALFGLGEGIEYALVSSALPAEWTGDEGLTCRGIRPDY